MLQVEIREAKKLKDRLIFGNIEPYVIIKLDSISYTTKIDYFQIDPKFYQKFYFDSKNFEEDKKELEVLLFLKII
jgi:hypothetical protein